MNENEEKKTAPIETAAEQTKSSEELKSEETVNEEQIVRPRMHWLPMTVLILNLISAIIQIFPAIGISYVGTTFRVINILTVVCAILFIAGMLCKKRWALIGFFIYRIVGFFMIVSFFGMYDDTAVAKNLCGTILIIIVFCFKRDGYNVFDLLWNNGVINEKPVVTPKKNETMAVETTENLKEIKTDVIKNADKAIEIDANSKLKENADVRKIIVNEQESKSEVIEKEEKKKRHWSIHNPLKNISFNWRKIFLWIFIILIVGGICTGGYYAYDYYTNTYLPEKRIEEACKDLENKWQNVTSSEKITMAKAILTKNYAWNYDNVKDSDIKERFAKPNYRNALDFIENEAYSGDSYCQYLLGNLYYYDNVFVLNEDKNKAAYWWREAALNGSGGGYNNLGMAYEDGIGVKRDIVKALECYKKAGEYGSHYGLYNVGRLYETGRRIVSGYHYKYYNTFDNSPEQWSDEFVRSDWNGHDIYYVYKRKVNDYKVVIPKNIDRALEYYRLAASLGNQSAKEKLQRIYE